MITENLSTLKIHKLTKEQYEREFAAGRIDESALYLTPDEEIDLSGYATIEQLEGKADDVHMHNIGDITDLQVALDSKQPIGDYAYKSDISSLETKADAANKLEDAISYTDSVASGKADKTHGLHVPECSTSNNGQFLSVIDGTPTWQSVDDIASDDDVLEFLMDMGYVVPLASSSNAIYTDNFNKIYTL